MDDEMIIDKELLRAIGAETRISILKSLSDHQKTQSDLAKELGLSPPTVLEHLEQLSSAGLVEKIEEGRKWKYYILSSKGRKLMSSSKKRIPINTLILLGAFLIFLSAAFLYNNPFVVDSPLETAQEEISKESSEETSDGSEMADIGDSEILHESPEYSGIITTEQNNQTNSTNSSS